MSKSTLKKRLRKTVWVNRGWQSAFIAFCPSERAWNRSMKQMNVDNASFIAFCPSERAWNRSMKQMNVDNASYPAELAGCMTTIQTGNGRTVLIVTLADRLDEGSELEAIGVAVHECIHVLQDVKTGMAEHTPGVEFEAYAVQCVFQEIWTAYLQTRKPKFKKRPRK